MLQRLEDRLLDGHAVDRLLGDPGDPRPEKDVGPESSSGPGLRQVAKPRNVAVEPAGAIRVAGARQGATSQHVRSLPPSR
jgi:hypothetical protein